MEAQHDLAPPSPSSGATLSPEAEATLDSLSAAWACDKVTAMDRLLRSALVEAVRARASARIPITFEGPKSQLSFGVRPGAHVTLFFNLPFDMDVTNVEVVPNRKEDWGLDFAVSCAGVPKSVPFRPWRGFVGQQIAVRVHCYGGEENRMVEGTVRITGEAHIEPPSTEDIRKLAEADPTLHVVTFLREDGDWWAIIPPATPDGMPRMVPLPGDMTTLLRMLRLLPKDPAAEGTRVPLLVSRAQFPG